ncbi:MAG TPA: UvrD-helicase domain-containing protein [Verrucomicrobiae bacterium]|jgi:ATP-dependent helicase/nuclease subunit A
MEKAPDNLTPAQRQAVVARGNVLVMAGAGTGKTKTLVARCLDCLHRDRASLDELLIVTFTEAAAAEMRLRLRRAIEVEASNHDAGGPTADFWQEQLARFDIAHIGTLHSFCLKLVREHFHELGLDPQISLLDEGEARQLADATLDEQFQTHYANEDEFSRAVQNLIQTYGDGRDERIRTLVLRLHHYSQTRPDAAGWLGEQLQRFSAAEPAAWSEWLLTAIAGWREEWLPRLEILAQENPKALELAGVLARLPKDFSRDAAAEVLAQITNANATVSYPKGQAGRLRPALGSIFTEAAFLNSVAAVKNGEDPLLEDWGWVRNHMMALLRLVQEFSGHFARRKSTDSVLDFHDLEQFALKLLWNFSTQQPTATAEIWRNKLRFIFVDEYQDINAAQDKIIAAISHDADGLSPQNEPLSGNRFLVGDVKQSIYRFRLANPTIFRDYARDWHHPAGQTISLSENFRSREGLLDFLNSVFRLVMHEAIGGVGYDAEAQLKFGARANQTADGTGPRTELLLRFKKSHNGRPDPESEADDELADLDESAREARLIAQRLKQLAAEAHEIWDDEQKIFRAASFGDMAVLLRSPRTKAEIFAQEFERAGVPLAIARGGFYDSSEILDLLSLLNLLDNPLQDLPCIAVLRSPLVGLSLAELAEIRLVARREHFWTALVRSGQPEAGLPDGLRGKLNQFLTRFSRWRKLARQASLSECLEQVLTETYYADWLPTRPRGEQRAANVERLLQLAQQFDQFQRQGLFRFLKFIEAQREIEVEPDVPASATENAVRLMSIHQSKGLEFPVVVVANLAKSFNESDRHNAIILDEQFGLCPQVKPPGSQRRYPSLPHWLAQKNQHRELRGEELRLLYVALTRARDTLILSAGISETKWETVWTKPEPVSVQTLAEAKSFADWLALWFAQNARAGSTTDAHFKDPTKVGQASDWHILPRFSLRWRWVEDAELTPQPTEDPAGLATNPPPPAEVLRREALAMESLDDATAEKLHAVLSWEYPHTAATRHKAKASVTELRRAADETDDEAEPVFTPRYSRRSPETPASSKTKLNAAEIGAAHHKFLQHLALTKTGDLAAEAGRLVREHFLSADERAVLDLGALAYFWDSPLGKKICALPPNLVQRELPFTARFSPAELGRIIHRPDESAMAGEFVIVQGVADLAVLLPDEIWLVDFKTDEIHPGELPEKIRTYTPQLQLYAAALEKIFAKKVTRRSLHFLAARRTEEI